MQSTPEPRSSGDSYRRRTVTTYDEDSADSTEPRAPAARRGGWSRRGFLRGATAMTVPLLLPGGLGLPSTVFGASRRRSSPSERVTIGLIGCGSMGNANLNGFLGLDDVQVVAVCDPDAGRRAASRRVVEARYAEESRSGAFTGCSDHADFRDLLARDDIDAVIQATPDHWHALTVIAAAEAGKDIYGEKPLSLTIRQGRIMADTVARYGRVFQTGSQQRSDARFRFACELVLNGYIGTVHRVVCGLPTGHETTNHQPQSPPQGFDYDMWLGPAPDAPYCENRTHSNFRWILDYSGGQVTDWGAHHIDIAHWGLGLARTGPIAVEGRGEFPRDGLYDAAVHYEFRCRYANGVEMVVTDDFENGVRWEGSDGWVFVSRSRIDAEPFSLLQHTLAPDDVHLPRSAGHRRDFIDAVRTRGATIAPIEEAHRTITVAHLGNLAMQLGRRLRWDPDREAFIDDALANRMRDRAMRGSWRLA